MEDFQQIQQLTNSQQVVRDRKCPQCGSRSETIFQKEASVATYVLSIISLFFFQFWSIFVIPIIVSATQQVTKRCYDCDKIIEKHDLFSLPSINDQILNFRFGTFAFIVSRKYAYAILAIFVIIFTYCQLTKETPAIIEEQQITNQQLDNTWTQYLKDCGSGVYQDNSVRANSHFQQTYFQNIINWEGVFLSCWEECPANLNNWIKEYYLKIKMDPTDSDSETFDIVLQVDRETHQSNIDVIKNLQQLDVVKFKAQFMSLGTDKSFHKLHLIKVEPTGRKIESIDKIQTAYEQGIFD
ncbi:LITAF-like zinc ribbon domain protein (macronuclear) [Tetrahymena thermophila SB210]|uniref:LITAF-like zinc ribbon domain protein n=1 Tax=Tetrahymena thermophila (strain SB210) TaxID=312017 RepID=Q22AB5_TETTS|nr:LITAF-like zinc ribbon domain protein [Tetrahymena thermophila SB210]EAR82234.2 LITAF-like zinc ribbon domain protein [Tetrahymena thermophila SB210]|eukprot:XP_001029897.2 LITAF-like zinc ribbon domain protein [Tetrahymena thermophila SB210]